MSKSALLITQLLNIFCFECYRLQDAYENFVQNQFPSRKSKAKIKATSNDSNETTKTDSNTSVQRRKRENNENIADVVESKKSKAKKLKSNEGSTNDESPSTSTEHFPNCK